MRLANVFDLGIKELRSVARDPVMLVLIVYAFTLAIYTAATAMPEPLNKAPIAIVDEDNSQLSARIGAAFYAPYFTTPSYITHAEMDRRMDAGLDTFALNIPPDFQSDVLAGEQPTIQLNVDATRITQALTGSSYVQTIITDEVRAFVARHRTELELPVALDLRARFNPQLQGSWFGAIMEVINQVTILSIVLTGAALIRERELGTIEHLLVMPVTPLEIMISKIWSMALVVLAASAVALVAVVQTALDIPIAGSIALFLAGAACHLFATTTLGIFLATFARSMPQFGLLMLLVLVPLLMLSGGITPRESMPVFVQDLMLAAPTTHFVMLAQAVLYRGAGLDVVWPQLFALLGIGGAIFLISLARFRTNISAGT